MSNPDAHRYTLPSLEKGVNRIISFVFYYRLAFVILALVGIGFFDYYVWAGSTPENKLKNAALVLTGGSIIIGIFYSLINYEHNQLKFKHEIKNSRETLTFTIACKMHDIEMINHFKAVKSFYEKHKQNIANNGDAVNQALKEDTETWGSLIVAFNYLECIAIGVQQGIIDEEFIKTFFKTIFRDYNNFYGNYFVYLRKERNSNSTYKNFTDLANKWGTV
jgi:hypothetical protein